MATSHALVSACRSAGALHAMLDARSTAMNRRTATTVNGTSYAIRYDAANRVVEEWMQVKDLPEASAGVAQPIDPDLDEPVAPTPPPPGSTQAVIDQYNADLAKYQTDLANYHRVQDKYNDDFDNFTEQRDYAYRVNTQARAVSGYERHLRSYNAVGQVVHEQGYQDNEQVKYHQINQSIDALGNARLTVTDSFVGDSATSTYAHAYFRGLYSAQQASTTGSLRINSGTLAGQTGASSTSTLSYDASGNLISVGYQTFDSTSAGSPTSKSMVYDAQGHILESIEVDYKAKTITQREIIAADQLQLRTSSTTGSFGGEAGQAAAYEDGINKDASQTPLTPVPVSATGTPANSSYVIIAAEGESLRTLALRAYGNADAWYHLADANQLDPNQSLKGGQAITVPSLASNSSTELEYNNAKLVGSTDPNLPSPTPPAKDGCLTLIVVVIAVVVACYLGPLALQFTTSVFGPGLAASVAATGLTAAATSIVSQGAGIALGVQDKFSWKAVGKSALNAMLLGGASIPGLEGLSVVQVAAVNAAAGAMRSVVSQLIQGSFSWRKVAAAAVASGVSSAVSQSFNVNNVNTNNGTTNIDTTNTHNFNIGEQFTASLLSNAASMAITNKGKINGRDLLINTTSTAATQYIGQHADDLGGVGSIGHILAQSGLGAITARLRHQDAWAGAIGAGVATYANSAIQDLMKSMDTPIDTSNPNDRLSVNGIDNTGNRIGISSIVEHSLADRVSPTGELMSSLTSLVGGTAARLFGRDFNVAAEAAGNVARNDSLARVQREQSLMQMQKERRAQGRIKLITPNEIAQMTLPTVGDLGLTLPEARFANALPIDNSNSDDDNGYDPFSETEFDRAFAKDGGKIGYGMSGPNVNRLPRRSTAPVDQLKLSQVTGDGSSEPTMRYGGNAKVREFVANYLKKNPDAPNDEVISAYNRSIAKEEWIRSENSQTTKLNKQSVVRSYSMPEITSTDFFEGVPLPEWLATNTNLYNQPNIAVPLPNNAVGETIAHAGAAAFAVGEWAGEQVEGLGQLTADFYLMIGKNVGIANPDTPYITSFARDDFSKIGSDLWKGVSNIPTRFANAYNANNSYGMTKAWLDGVNVAGGIASLPSTVSSLARTTVAATRAATSYARTAIDIAKQVEFAPSLDRLGFANQRGAVGLEVNPSIEVSSSTELSRGAILREKYGHISKPERQSIIFERTEEIARQQLLAKRGGHFMERHAPAVPLSDQLKSAATGLRPDGKLMISGGNKRFTVDSSQFFTNKDMLYGINRAERIQQYAIGNGQPINGYISLKYSDFVGGGFVKNTPMFGASNLPSFYRSTQYANFGINPTTGKAITAYPVLSPESLGILF